MIHNLKWHQILLTFSPDFFVDFSMFHIVKSFFAAFSCLLKAEGKYMVIILICLICEKLCWIWNAFMLFLNHRYYENLVAVFFMCFYVSLIAIQFSDIYMISEEFFCPSSKWYLYISISLISSPYSSPNISPDLTSSSHEQFILENGLISNVLM